MTASNFVNKQFPFLPDAPTVTSLPDMAGESPYHISSPNQTEDWAAKSTIFMQAISFVHDFSKNINGKLDFSRESLGLVDNILQRAVVPQISSEEQKENLIISVAEFGSYIGTILYAELHAQWHTSSPEYYFSALRFKTLDGKIIETSPFAQVVKKILDKENPNMLNYFEFIEKTVKGNQTLNYNQNN